MHNDDSMHFFEQLAKEGELEQALTDLVNDDRFPVFISERFFTPKQWDALTEEIPMTQEIFDKCLWVCDHVNDGVNFHRIVEQFPDLKVNFSKEIQEKHKEEHDKFKAEYLAKWGDKALFFTE